MANIPVPNEIVDGFRFKGGDPADKSSWEPATAPRAGDIQDGFEYKGGDPGKQESWAKYEPKGFMSKALGVVGDIGSGLLTAPSTFAETLVAGGQMLHGLSPQGQLEKRLSPETAAARISETKGFLDKSQEAREFIYDKTLSDDTKAAMQEQSAIAQDKDLGLVEGAKVAIGQGLMNPVNTARQVVENIPSLLAGGASMRAVKGGGAMAEAGAGYATTGVLEGGGAYSQTLQEGVKKLTAVDDETLANQFPSYADDLRAGVTREQAIFRLADRAATTAGSFAALLAPAVDKVMGGQKLDQALFTKSVAKDNLPKAMGKEFAGESMQGGIGQLGQNIGAKAYVDPEQGLTEGVGASAGSEGLAGLATAGGMHVLAGRQPTASTVKPTGDIHTDLDAVLGAPVTPITGNTGAMDDVGLSEGGPTEPPAPGPTVMQPRDRDRAASIAQMQSIANTPDFDRLADAPTPTDGAPVVSVKDDAPSIPEDQLGNKTRITFADGTKIPIQYAVVEAGSVLASNRADGGVNQAYHAEPQAGEIRALTNGRVAGLQASFEKGTSEGYVAGLKERAPDLGIDPAVIEKMANPILVRVYPDRINQEIPNIGELSNAGGGMSMSDTEKAAQDQTRLKDLAGLYPDDSGNFNNAASMPFIKRFIGSLPENERGNLMAGDGSISASGIRRLRSAVFAKAYGTGDVLSRVTESLDDNVRKVTAGMLIAAPRMAELRARMDAGRVQKDLDITADFAAATEEFSRLRAEGYKVDEYLKLGNLIDSPYSPETTALLEQLAEISRSQKRVAEFLNNYADAVEANGSLDQADMIGREPVTKSQVLNTALEKSRAKESESLPLEGQPASPAGTENREQPATETSPPASDQAPGFNFDQPSEKVAAKQEGGTPTDKANTTVFEEDGKTLFVDDGKAYDMDAPKFGFPNAFKTPLPADSPLLVPTIKNNTKERVAWRKTVVARHFEGAVPVEGRKPILYLMGGGGASGKGTIKDTLKEQGVIPSSGTVDIDPDEIKTAEWGIPEYRQIVAEGDSRAAATVHDESGQIARAVRDIALGLPRAKANGSHAKLMQDEAGPKYDIVLDVTLSADKDLEIIQRAKDQGYEVRLYGVMVDPRQAVVRANNRAIKSFRYVPLNILLQAHKGFARIFEKAAALVDKAQLFDNTSKESKIIAKADGGSIEFSDEKRYNDLVELNGEINENADTLSEVSLGKKSDPRGMGQSPSQGRGEGGSPRQTPPGQERKPGDGSGPPDQPVSQDQTKKTPPSGGVSAFAGEKINEEWTAFSKESGTLGIPRAEMPQVKVDHRGALLQFLDAKGITYAKETVPASDLKPTQAEFSQKKVDAWGKEESKDFERSVIVAKDGRILDGHHQWLYALQNNEPISIIRLDESVRPAMAAMAEFPSATTVGGKAPDTKSYGSSNKVVSIDAANDAREVLRKQAGKLNAGLDPDMAKAALKLAAFHIEAGARSFADFSKAMVKDLGKAIKPYLKSLYETVSGQDLFAGMDKPADVAKAAPEEIALADVPKNFLNLIKVDMPIMEEDGRITVEQRSAREALASINRQQQAYQALRACVG